ncbi:hypothetical protein C7T94_13525 [Pedobacter yulinensis]|uniref:Uncharacterized protein n=1 Tax=Pedobacter yulinensis TaxID=2126353 RepID=A0A2T3HM95_9SPHI|nr:hypothetical protein C7T94_13525 [Pedobacter yulinensis]
MNETRHIDRCLRGTPDNSEQFLFQARRLLDPAFDASVKLQQRCYRLVRDHARAQVRAEIAAADQQVFSFPEHRGLRDRLYRLFK